MSTEVRYQQDGPIARITFAGPKGINILSTTVLDEIEKFLDQAAGQSDVRILILTGAERTFLAGADIDRLPVPVAEPATQRIEHRKDHDGGPTGDQMMRRDRPEHDRRRHHVDQAGANQDRRSLGQAGDLMATEITGPRAVGVARPSPNSAQHRHRRSRRRSAARGPRCGRGSRRSAGPDS